MNIVACERNGGVVSLLHPPFDCIIKSKPGEYAAHIVGGRQGRLPQDFPDFGKSF
jgi:hypothetical protein